MFSTTVHSTMEKDINDTEEKIMRVLKQGISDDIRIFVRSRTLPDEARAALRKLEEKDFVYRRTDFFKESGRGDGFKLTEKGLRKIGSS